VSRLKQYASRFIQRLQGKQVVHFLHIGKTGGTAVRHALHEHPVTRRFVIRLHPHEVKLRDVPVGEGVIFFVRDPITRFVSAFYSRQRQGQPRYLSPWSPAEKEAFDSFKTPNQLSVALSSADSAERARAEKAMRDISVVKDSYWVWFENEDYFASRAADIFFVGFQERLNEDFEAVKLLLGLPADMKLPADDVQAHRNPAHLDRKLEDRAVANLQEWYKDDFRFIRICNALIEQRRAVQPGTYRRAG
jgi:Sulfotransferase family